MHTGQQQENHRPGHKKSVSMQQAELNLFLRTADPHGCSFGRHLEIPTIHSAELLVTPLLCPYYISMPARSTMKSTLKT